MKIKLSEVIFDVVFFLVVSQILNFNFLRSIYDSGIAGQAFINFLTISVVSGCTFMLYYQFLFLPYDFKGKKWFIFFLLIFTVFFSIYSFIYVFNTLNTLSFGLEEHLFLSISESALVVLIGSVGLVIFSFLLVFFIDFLVVLKEKNTISTGLSDFFESMIRNEDWLLTGEKLLFIALFILTPIVFALLIFFFGFFIYALPMSLCKLLYDISGNELIGSSGWILYSGLLVLLTILVKKLRKIKVFVKKTKALKNQNKKLKIYTIPWLRQIFSKIKVNQEFYARLSNEVFFLFLIFFINFYYEFLLDINGLKQLDWKVLWLSGVIPARLYLFLSPPIKLSGLFSAIGFIIAYLLYSNLF